MADTGNSATVTFATSAFSAAITSIDVGEQSVPVLDKSHLGTTGYIEKMVGDLVDAGEFVLEFFLDPNNIPTVGTTELVTITYPIPAGDTNGATLAGTVIVSKFKPGTLVNNELIKATLTGTWDGVTGPSWTESN